MRRIAHRIAIRFRNDDKFSGNLSEDLNEAINLYLDAANDYELKQDQWPKYFHNIFVSCSEGDEVGSPSGRAPHVRGAGVDSGDHPWGNRHGVRACNAVGRLREKVGK